MNESLQLLDAEEVDEATIDGAVEGASSGHGVLASMMSWIRETVSNVLPGSLLGGVHSTELPRIDPKLASSTSKFDPTTLMSALQAYNQRYGRLLQGDGLLIRIGQELPPSAFPATAGIEGNGQLLDTSSFHFADFENPRAAIDAISAQPFAPTLPAPDHVEFDPARAAAAALRASQTPVTNQFLWLVNATLVRAAVTMAPYVFSVPKVRVTAEPRVTLVFRHEGASSRLHIDSKSSPLSLHRQARESLQGIWRTALSTAAAQVQAEFLEAMRSQGIPRQSMEALTQSLKDAFRDHKPLNKMRGSSAAFINVKSIFDACVAATQDFDREAGRNAVRHSNGALTWVNYLPHKQPNLKAEIAAAESKGALAFAAYSPAVLAAIKSTVSPATAGANILGKLRGVQAPPRAYDGVLTSEFFAALTDGLTPASQVALQALSPRYLVELACGNGSIKSIEQYLQSCEELTEADDAELTRAAKAAGRRLAHAINNVTASTTPGRPTLPWARILTSETAYALLLNPDSDERAVEGLTSLIGYANEMRRKGETAKSQVWSLPDASTILEAPTGNAVASLVRFWGPDGNKSDSRLDAACEHLLGDLVSEFGQIQTQHGHVKGGAASCSLDWKLELGAVRRVSSHALNDDLRGGFRAVARHATGSKGACSLIEVYARTSEAFSKERQERRTDDGFAFAVRGAGTPDATPPLVFELRIAPETRLRRVVDSPSRKAGWVELNMTDISKVGIKKPYIASAVADTDRDLLSVMDGHVQSAFNQLRQEVTSMLGRRPFQAAALFPAVASFLWRDGKLSDAQSLKPLGRSTAFRLARSAAGAKNPYGMGLICRYARDAAYRSKSGRSLLDVAFASGDAKVAQGALEGLSKNSWLAKEKEGLAELVQASLPKLIELYPQLLPRALQAGAILDDLAHAAYKGLHPQTRTAELDAAVTAGLMDLRIRKASALQKTAASDLTDSETNQQPAPARARRRLGAI